jgi:hypothetical protein
MYGLFMPWFDIASDQLDYDLIDQDLLERRDKLKRQNSTLNARAPGQTQSKLKNQSASRITTGLVGTNETPARLSQTEIINKQMRRLMEEKPYTAQHKEKASKKRVKLKTNNYKRNILMRNILYSLCGISVLGIVWSGSRLSIQQIGYENLTPQQKIQVAINQAKYLNSLTGLTVLSLGSFAGGLFYENKAKFISQPTDFFNGITNTLILSYDKLTNTSIIHFIVNNPILFVSFGVQFILFNSQSN